AASGVGFGRHEGTPNQPSPAGPRMSEFATTMAKPTLLYWRVQDQSVSTPGRVPTVWRERHVEASYCDRSGRPGAERRRRRQLPGPRGPGLHRGQPVLRGAEAGRPDLAPARG